jgi:hypothetical protein
MTGKAKPEEIADDDLDAAQGGMNVEIGMAAKTSKKKGVLLFDEADAFMQRPNLKRIVTSNDI